MARSVSAKSTHLCDLIVWRGRLAVSGVATDQMGGATVQYDHTVKDERAAFTHYKREGEEVTEGLDATVRKKLAAKYDDALEADARDFIEHYTGVTIAPGPESLCKALHDGTVLCTLANALSPGVVKKVNKMKMVRGGSCASNCVPCSVHSLPLGAGACSLSCRWRISHRSSTPARALASIPHRHSR